MVEYVELKCDKCGSKVYATKHIASLSKKHLCVDCGVGKYKTPKLTRQGLE